MRDTQLKRLIQQKYLMRSWSLSDKFHFEAIKHIYLLCSLLLHALCAYIYRFSLPATRRNYNWFFLLEIITYSSERKWVVISSNFGAAKQKDSRKIIQLWETNFFSRFKFCYLWLIIHQLVNVRISFIFR